MGAEEWGQHRERDGRKFSDLNRCLELNPTKEVGGACGARGRAELWGTHTPIPNRHWSKVPGCRAEGTGESKVALGSQQSRGKEMQALTVRTWAACTPEMVKQRAASSGHPLDLLPEAACVQFLVCKALMKH